MIKGKEESHGGEGFLRNPKHNDCANADSKNSPCERVNRNDKKKLKKIQPNMVQVRVRWPIIEVVVLQDIRKKHQGTSDPTNKQKAQLGPTHLQEMTL